MANNGLHILSTKPPTPANRWPTVACRQCRAERQVRKLTRTICAICPVKPGLCSQQCFINYHRALGLVPAFVPTEPVQALDVQAAEYQAPDVPAASEQVPEVQAIDDQAPDVQAAHEQAPEVQAADERAPEVQAVVDQAPDLPAQLITIPPFVRCETETTAETTIYRQLCCKNCLTTGDGKRKTTRRKCGSFNIGLLWQ